MPSDASVPLPEPSSFRDPSGFLFRDQHGTLLRQINQSYAPHYEKLMQGGLYQALRERAWMVGHEEVDLSRAACDGAAYVLQPEELPFISYPYEWAFSALQDAALLTLDIQRLALKHGMSLKDASAFNVQFQGARPIFIDTLSFEQYEEGKPWGAYHQFCRHFLAPLTLMARRDVRLGRLLVTNIDGIPLDLASGLLPRRTMLSPSGLFHIHMHARLTARHADTTDAARATKVQQAKVSREGLTAIIDSLHGAVKKLRWMKQSEWSNYYDENSYTESSFDAKGRLVRGYLQRIAPTSVWDLGANTGEFSRIATELGAAAVAFDFDPASVELNYRQSKERGDAKLLPLLFDLTNPSPAIGWANAERQSLAQRGPVDVVMALALIHHLAIANNVPLARVAEYFRNLGRHLIIEFVPKEDVQTQRLLQSREDIFTGYHQQGFEQAFAEYFKIITADSIEGGRRMYLMEAI